MAKLPKDFYELIKIVDGDDMFGIDVNHPDLAKARALIGDKPFITKGAKNLMHKVFIYKGTKLVHQCEGYDAAGLFLKMSSTTVRNRADDGNPTRSGYTIKVEKK